MSEPKIQIATAVFAETIFDIFSRSQRQREFEVAVTTALAKIGMSAETFKALMLLTPQAGSIEKAGAELNIDPALIAALLAAFAQFGPILLKLLGL